MSASIPEAPKLCSCAICTTIRSNLYATLEEMEALKAQNRQLRKAHYLSTACWHEQHEQCRRECKFCAKPCHCECHALAAPEPKETK